MRAERKTLEVNHRLERCFLIFRNSLQPFKLFHTIISIDYYITRISHTNKQFSVPKFIETKYEKLNKDYSEFLGEKKKFIKPYDECTKFVDSLNKNKALLRRGQFDLPVAHEATISSTDNSKINTLRTQKTEFILSKPSQYRKS